MRELGAYVEMRAPANYVDFSSFSPENHRSALTVLPPAVSSPLSLEAKEMSGVAEVLTTTLRNSQRFSPASIAFAATTSLLTTVARQHSRVSVGTTTGANSSSAPSAVRDDEQQLQKEPHISTATMTTIASEVGATTSLALNNIGDDDVSTATLAGSVSAVEASSSLMSVATAEPMQTKTTMTAPMALEGNY